MKFDLPDPGEGIAEASLVEWQVSEGDHVDADDPVASVETDKAVVDIPIPETGTIDELLVDQGETAVVGEPFLEYTPGDKGASESDGQSVEPTSTEQIHEDQTKTEDKSEETGSADESFVKPPEQPSKPVKAMPRVRHKARKENIDLDNVNGTGPNDRVTLDDVKAVINNQEAGEDMTSQSDPNPSSDQTTKEQPDEPSEVEDQTSEAHVASDKADEDEAPKTTEKPSREHTTSTSKPDNLEDDGAAVQRFRAEGIKAETPRDSHESEESQRQASTGDDQPSSDKEHDGEDEDHAVGVDQNTSSELGEKTGDETSSAEDEVQDTAEPSTPPNESETQKPERHETMKEDEEGQDVPDNNGREDKSEQADKVNTLQGTRRVIAENMRHSLESTAQTTITEEVDVTQLVNLHDVITEDNDAPITYLAYFVKAATKTLKAFPGFNATFEEDGVTEHDEVNLGIAVDTERGLLVPVIERADHQGLEGLAYSIADLAERTRSDDNEPGDFDDATFTVSSLGSIGGEVFTPILNPPQVAILGVGRIKERPRYHDDELVKANVVHLSLTIDHQVIDGADAARFLNDIKGRLESPKDLLLINV